MSILIILALIPFAFLGLVIIFKASAWILYVLAHEDPPAPIATPIPETPEQFKARMVAVYNKSHEQGKAED